MKSTGDEEYRKLDVFCKTIGILRQMSEANNQASNGKAKRMRQTIMNIVHSMAFSNGLPLRFWCIATEYAVYIFNKTPTKGKLRHVSPIEMLNKKISVLSAIVVFGSPWKVHKDLKNKSLGERGKAG